MVIESTLSAIAAPSPKANKNAADRFAYQPETRVMVASYQSSRCLRTAATSLPAADKAMRTTRWTSFGAPLSLIVCARSGMDSVFPAALAPATMSRIAREKLCFGI